MVSLLNVNLVNISWYSSLNMKSYRNVFYISWWSFKEFNAYSIKNEILIDSQPQKTL